MNIKSYILAILMLMSTVVARSQNEQAHFRIRYVINRPEVDSTFVDNAARISDMREFLRMLRTDTLIHVTSVEFCGTASPDGAYDFNVWLSENRLRTFKELVNSYLYIPDSIIHANVSDIPWDGFRAKVAESDLPHRDEILSIIDEGPSLVPWYNNRRIDPRLLKLRKMYKGQVWETLKSPILRDLRYGDAVFTYFHLQPIFTYDIDYNDMSRPLEAEVRYKSKPQIKWLPHAYLKTNFIGLGMLMANLAYEFDFAPYWSVTFPIYYSAVDYFKSTIKFRNFTIQPEVRYWFSLKNDGLWLYNDGWFAGAHLEMSYYNFAFDGQYRFQDYRGRTPALGGGLSLGYRMPLGRNKRWKMEFTVGAGIYPLDYDLFDNTPDVIDGQLMDRKQKTYIGLDQAAISIAYTFDRTRRARIYTKGGRR